MRLLVQQESMHSYYSSQSLASPRANITTIERVEPPAVALTPLIAARTKKLKHVTRVVIMCKKTPQSSVGQGNY